MMRVKFTVLYCPKASVGADAGFINERPEEIRGGEV
jgi:hypothetical protein